MRKKGIVNKTVVADHTKTAGLITLVG